MADPVRAALRVARAHLTDDGFHALSLRRAQGDLAVGDSGEAGEVSGGHPGSVADPGGPWRRGYGAAGDPVG